MGTIELSSSTEHEHSYPLRPELAESTYYLARTFPDDPTWYYLAIDMVRTLKEVARVVSVCSVLSFIESQVLSRVDMLLLTV
jgi:hypothetical protein